jgi:ribose-phosphate pyrophosphokinase
MGGSKRANVYAKLLNCGVVICYKERTKANEIGIMKVLGDVEGKDVIIIDDMVDTAGTLTKAANLMIEMELQVLELIVPMVFYWYCL